MKSGYGNRILTGILILLHLIQWIVPTLMLANPTGPAVVGGHATVSGVGTAHVTVNQASQQAILNWQSFNIAPNEVTQFIQPNASSVALNRIFDQNPSQIMGSLRANGTVMLVNPNGVFFGPNAQVNVGGLVASSLNISNANFLAGHYLFEGAGVEGAVKNLGLIRGIHDGVYLLAPNVENSGVITASGGNIVLAAGAKAYLASRPDGRGFLTELSAPTGQAANVKDLIADGGHVTLAGRVVNQQGLIQANSVREKNGKIELFASEQVTLKTGSQTLAKGGSEGISNGGTIVAIADKTKGTTLFEKGATIDVSGGPQGGNGGFIELSASRVTWGGAFLAHALAGYRGGKLRIDPVFDGNNPITTETLSALTGQITTGGLNDIEFQSTGDMSVEAQFNLSAWVLPQGQSGTLRFNAGQDLRFKNTFLSNLSIDQSSAPTKWDIVGTAGRDILFTNDGSTGIFSTVVSTTQGGSITLNAKQDVNLIDPLTGNLGTVHAQGGGGVSITTGRDLKTGIGFDALTNDIQGIYVEGAGRLNLQVGQDLVGGRANGVERGPGFVVWNKDLTARPQHTVTVGGKIGETNLPLGPSGLPLTDAEQRANNPAADPIVERVDKYAEFILSGGSLTVTAGGNIYLRRVQDAGLLGGLDVVQGLRTLSFAPGLENNNITLVSRTGHILLNTNSAQGPPEIEPDPSQLDGSLLKLRDWLPASFEARAEQGTIQIRSNLTFLPSATGSVRFFAKNNIEGVPKVQIVDDPTHFDWIWIGRQGVPGGHWDVVDLRTLAQRPDLAPYLQNLEKRGHVPLEAKNTPKPDVPPGGRFIYPAFNPPKWPLNTRILLDGGSPHVRLLEVDPQALMKLGPAAIPEDGTRAYSDVLRWASASPTDTTVPLAHDSTAPPTPVSFRAEVGNISKVALDLVSRGFRKEVTIEAGGTIDKVLASMSLPDLGKTTQTVTEHIPLVRDPNTNQLRGIKPDDVILFRAFNPQTRSIETKQWDGKQPIPVTSLVNVEFRDVQVSVETPHVAATIKAKDFLLNKNVDGNTDGGFVFFGPGTARIIATNNLNLGDGRGITSGPRPDRTGERGGLIDIAVGNKLEMVLSSISSSSGAGVSIHGYDAAKPYVLGYDNSALYPLQLPDSARAGLNLPAAGGNINVGDNSPRSPLLEHQTTGILVTTGGSVGQRAKDAVVNQAGSVSVNVEKDPAAILIRTHGNVDVNKSRIATFRGGDIRITSTNGSINAGSGSKNNLEFFSPPNGTFDEHGNENLDPAVPVPGSGIFTFHPDDPRPLTFPLFNDPEIKALLAQAARERTFGRDVSSLEVKANQLLAERSKTFEEQVLNPFIDKLKLSDITLTAETGVRAIARNTIPTDGSGRIIIPEAGIQGRNVNLNGVLDFRGGAVTGRVLLPPNAAVVGQPSFVGGPPPPGVAPPPPPLSGGGSAAAASSTAASTSSSVKNADATQEAASESSSKQTGADRVASSTGSKKDEETKLAKAVRVKRGVVIQVDVKPQAPSAN